MTQQIKQRARLEQVGIHTSERTPCDQLLSHFALANGHLYICLKAGQLVAILSSPSGTSTLTINGASSTDTIRFNATQVFERVVGAYETSDCHTECPSRPSTLSNTYEQRGEIRVDEEGCDASVTPGRCVSSWMNGWACGISFYLTCAHTYQYVEFYPQQVCVPVKHDVRGFVLDAGLAHGVTTAQISHNRFISTWQTRDKQTGHGSIKAQEILISADGSSIDKNGEEWVVADKTTYNCDTPPSVDSNAGRVAITASCKKDGADVVIARVFRTEGSSLVSQGSAFDVRALSTMRKINPVTAWFKQGFVVVWEEANQDNTEFTLAVKAFDINGKEVWPQRTIAKLNEPGQCQVTANADNAELTLVCNRRDAVDFDIVSKKITLDSIGNWTAVMERKGNDTHPFITAGPNGYFSLSWKCNAATCVAALDQNMKQSGEGVMIEAADERPDSWVSRLNDTVFASYVQNGSISTQEFNLTLDRILAPNSTAPIEPPLVPQGDCTHAQCDSTISTGAMIAGAISSFAVGALAGALGAWTFLRLYNRALLCVQRYTGGAAVVALPTIGVEMQPPIGVVAPSLDNDAAAQLGIGQPA